MGGRRDLTAHPLEPSGWPKAKATYETITKKLHETEKKLDGTTKAVTDEDRLNAINYWVQCLLSDAIDIAKSQYL